MLPLLFSGAPTRFSHRLTGPPRNNQAILPPPAPLRAFWHELCCIVTVPASRTTPAAGNPAFRARLLRPHPPPMVPSRIAPFVSCRHWRHSERTTMHTSFSRRANGPTGQRANGPTGQRARSLTLSLAALALAALAPTARAQTQDMFVSIPGSSTISRFAGTGPGTFSTTATMLAAGGNYTNGVNGLAFDASGDLFSTASASTKSQNSRRELRRVASSRRHSLKPSAARRR